MKSIVGTVISAKKEKTVSVFVERLFQAPVYKKVIKKRKKFSAHDLLGAKEGDRVRLVETRPMSKSKHWRVVEIVSRAELLVKKEDPAVKSVKKMPLVKKKKEVKK